jgi:predicted nucleotidyltransferase
VSPVTAAPTDFRSLIEALAGSRVEFILIGGVAATLHGSARATLDLDVVYRRSQENVDRLVRALSALSPYLRGAPPGLPFVFDAATIGRGLNFTLDTRFGALDLLGEVTGGGSYDALLPHTEIVDLFGHACRVVTLNTLIRLKRAAGRPKDNEVLAELEALRERRGEPGG